MERVAVLWSGALGPRALTCHDRPERRLLLDAREQSAMAAMLLRREAAGQRIVRGAGGALPALYRLESFESRQDGLSIALGRTDYGEYLFTNVEHPERRAASGDAAMSDALAVCAVLVCGDGCVPFGVRAAGIADRAPDRRLHVLPAGHPEPPASPLEGLLAELREEAGVEPHELERVVLTGLVRALPGGKPELTYLLETRVTFDELRARERPDAWEFAALDSFAWEPEAVASWLRAHAHETAPPGLAAIELGARAAFGRGDGAAR